MFNFFRTEDEAELRTTNKALLKQIKNLNRTIEELQEDLDEQAHETYRSHRMDVRDLEETLEDRDARYERDLTNATEKANQRADDRIEENDKKNQQALVAKDTKIAELQSTVRELELAAEEDTLDVDLQIQEGINEFKEEHSEDVTALQVKLATSMGETKTAQAYASSKDAIIKILTDLVESRGEDVSEMIEFAQETISAVAPTVDLSDISFNVNVPQQQTKNGGEQQKKN